MEPSKERTIGDRGFTVTQLGFGSLGLADGVEMVGEEQALATVDAAYEGGVRFFDTAPWYGRGLSEHRLGSALYRRPRETCVVATKIGRRLVSARKTGKISPNVGGSIRRGCSFEVWFDYTYDGIMRSYEDSLHRLRTDYVDAVFIHDLDELYHRPAERLSAKIGELLSSGWRALEELRDTAGVRAIGAGINRATSIPRLLELFDVDVLLVATPYTLLHQEILDAEFVLCSERGIKVIIGSVFQSGLLAAGVGGSARYNYSSEIPIDIVEKVRRMAQVCESYGIPLAAAALQFPLGHPLVVSVLAGAFTPEQVREHIDFMRVTIPAGLWDTLKTEGLLHRAAPVPVGP